MHLNKFNKKIETKEIKSFLSDIKNIFESQLKHNLCLRYFLTLNKKILIILCYYLFSYNSFLYYLIFSHKIFTIQILVSKKIHFGPVLALITTKEHMN
jgi:hypothetical protein